MSKTKMILRNDPAKKNKCDNCNEEYDDLGWEFDPSNIVTNDLSRFLDKQEHWAEFNGPTICLQLLRTIFKIVFFIAPSNRMANKMILDVMEDFNGEESAKS
tara:strand:- start:26 stop:331 length:306 start_codon:yes stop_codon:yes gene_type:complete